MTRISALVLTRDAEASVRTCLESLAWVDEIVVMDDYSHDRTPEIARELHARVHTRRLETFSAQRNAALACCTGEWVLAVDDDERVTPELRREIQALLDRDVDERAFDIPRKNFFRGRWIRGCGWYPNHVRRLFRREGARYLGDVHERLEVNGRVGTLRSPLEHESYESLDEYLGKLNRYTTLAAAEMHRAGRRASAHELVTQPALTFFSHYILQRGVLEGLDGLVICMLSSFYVMVKYAKLYYLREAR